MIQCNTLNAITYRFAARDFGDIFDKLNLFTFVSKIFDELRGISFTIANTKNDNKSYWECCNSLLGRGCLVTSVYVLQVVKLFLRFRHATMLFCSIRNRAGCNNWHGDRGAMRTSAWASHNVSGLLVGSRNLLVHALTRKRPQISTRRNNLCFIVETRNTRIHLSAGFWVFVDIPAHKTLKAL